MTIITMTTTLMVLFVCHCGGTIHKTLPYGLKIITYTIVVIGPLAGDVNVLLTEG